MKSKSGSSKWGLGVAAIVGSFVLFITSLVLFASFQNFQLVEAEYYERSLDYQEQIDRRIRSLELEQPLKIEHQPDKSQLLISLDQADASQVTGTIKMHRPSNARLDHEWSLNLDKSGQQVIAISGMVRGQWSIEIEWSLDTIDFLDETRIFIQ